MEKILIHEQEIKQKVSSITEYFNSQYNQQNEHQVIFVPILQGGVTFFQEVCKGLTFDPYVEYAGLSSYDGTEQKEFNLYKMVDPALIRGREVWLFDDIADSGKTLDFLGSLLKQYGATSVKSCVLLKKRKCPHPVDLHAFEMGDEWVWGCGMDAPNGRGRALRNIFYK